MGRSRAIIIFVSDWLVLLALTVAVPTWLYVAALLARDADRRGANGGLVGAAFVLVWPIGFLLWLRARVSGGDRDGKARGP